MIICTYSQKSNLTEAILTYIEKDDYLIIRNDFKFTTTDN